MRTHLFLLLMTSSLAFAEQLPESKFIDMHLHLTGQERLKADEYGEMTKAFERYMKNPNVEAALMLTHTYLISQYDKVSRRDKEEINSYYSKLVAKYPGR